MDNRKNCVESLGQRQYGLFLAVGIEKAFDKLQISFVKSNPLKGDLYLRIWDETCRSTPLWPGCNVTIGDFDGCALSLGEHQPFKRCLSYQAYQAYQAYLHCSSVEKEAPTYFGTPTSSDFHKVMTLEEVLRGEVLKTFKEEHEDSADEASLMSWKEDDTNGKDDEQERDEENDSHLKNYK